MSTSSPNNVSSGGNKTNEQKYREFWAKSIGVVEQRQSIRARNRVTCVRAIDIDNDGDIEIIVGAADGRLTLLSKECEPRWSRVVGNKSPIATITILPYKGATRALYYIVVGTESGYLYVFNYHGQTINKDRSSNAFSEDGKGDEEAFWFRCEESISEASVTRGAVPDIIFTSEDRYVYSLDSSSVQLNWTFKTQGWARHLFVQDLNNDDHCEILVSTANGYLYLLNHKGQLLMEPLMMHTVRALHVADINNDNKYEILIATDKNDLQAFAPYSQQHPYFEEKWKNEQFNKRLRALDVVDIDGNDIYEIIAGGDDEHLYILNTDGEIIWRYFLGARIASMCTCDIDGDGSREIIIGADDDHVHVLHINPMWAREGLYREMRAMAQAEDHPSLPTDLNASARELLRDIMYSKPDEPVSLPQAEDLLKRGHFEQALTAFLQLKHQKMQVLWQDETEYEIRMIYFGSVLGDLIISTTDNLLRAYNADGQHRWSLQLEHKILSAQAGRVRGPGSEDILICSTDRSVYHIGYKNASANAEQPEILHSYELDPLISSVALKPGYRQAEIVVGSEDKKIYVYRDGLKGKRECIPTNQGIRLVQLYQAKKTCDNTPDIVAARTDHYVAAYKYNEEKELWSFKAHNRVRTLSIDDIDGDGHEEVIIGSEDRNVHAVDDHGNLKWRYYLPHNVLSTHVADIDRDNRREVLAGCADGYLYVFDQNGNLLWKYLVDERITAIASREHDGVVELALGTERRLSKLQVIDAAFVQRCIDRCWEGLIQKKSEKLVAYSLIEATEEPLLRAFVLQKAANLLGCEDGRLPLFKQFVKAPSVEVRKAVVRALIDCYVTYPIEIQQLLEELSTDQNREVRLTLIAHIDQLMHYNWQLGFDYLVRFSSNVDRFVRRAVMRKLYSLVNDHQEDHQKNIFHLLLYGACDQRSFWVSQEAARTLAHFLDTYHGEILRNIYYFISHEVKQEILLHMAHQAKVTTVRETLESLLPLLEDDVNIADAAERLDNAVQALTRIRESKFGEDTLLLFRNLHNLFELQTIPDIAQYHCDLRDYAPEEGNAHFISAKQVFEATTNVTRNLKIYLQRRNSNDRIASLQDACRAIERLQQFMDTEYRDLLKNEYRMQALDEYNPHIQSKSPHKIPDYHFLKILFGHWRNLFQEALNELRGEPKITVTLLTRQLYFEMDVSIMLDVQNIGRSPAYGVRIDLLHNEAFTIEPHATRQADILVGNDTLRAEFTIKFKSYQEVISLDFEITYDDGEQEFHKLPVMLPLTLQSMQPYDYEFVPNPYSTGTPVNDDKMFFGREGDIVVLKRELTLNTAQRVIVLHGLRRSGKTSLLRYLVKKDLLDNCIPIYIDMQNIVHEISTGRLFFRLTYHIQRAIMQKKSIRLPLPEPSAFKNDPTFVFDRFLDDVEDRLQGKRIVLLIDEFEILQEQAEQGMLKPTIFSYLRSMMQERNMNFLLAGTHRLEQLTKEYWAVFYNLALPYRLTKISEEGACGLITRPVASHLTYDSLAIEKIRQLAGDQPFLLHSLCRVLVDRCNDLRKTYITPHDVNALLPHAVMINNVQFKSLLQLIPPKEQLALTAIAHSGHERPLSFTEIEYVYRAENLPYDGQQLRDALGSLARQDLLESVMGEEEGELRYRIPIGLLRIWLLQEQSLAGLKQRL